VTTATYTPPQYPVTPGDWFVVDPREAIFDRIEWAEKLADWAEHRHDEAWQDWQRKRHDPEWFRWGHAGVATRWVTNFGDLAPGLTVSPGGKVTGTPMATGTYASTIPADGPVLMIAEAEPGGAVERPWHWEANPHMWSTSTGLSVPSMGPAARRYTQPGPWGQHGVPYAFPDYTAIAAKALHIPWPGLDAYMASALHMICSQLVDQVAQDRGMHLFKDGRAPGYVMPLDLAVLLLRRGRTVRSKPAERSA